MVPAIDIIWLIKVKVVRPDFPIPQTYKETTASDTSINVAQLTQCGGYQLFVVGTDCDVQDRLGKKARH